MTTTRDEPRDAHLHADDTADLRCERHPTGPRYCANCGSEPCGDFRDGACQFYRFPLTEKDAGFFALCEITSEDCPIDVGLPGMTPEEVGKMIARHWAT